MQLKDATDLERRVYEQCLAVEEMPASPEQTALVSTLSEAGHQLQTLRAENAELKRQVEAGLKLARDYVHDMEEVFCIPEEASAESVDMYEQAKALIALQAAKTGGME